MKKIMIMLLVLAMNVSLISCAAKHQIPSEPDIADIQTPIVRDEFEDNDTQPNWTLETEQQQTTEIEQQPTLETESQPILETEEPSSPAFDTSWASNEFERQIAEPTFDSWEVKSFIEGEEWIIFVKGVYYDAVKSYAKDLQSYGFSQNIDENDGFSGFAYIFSADNEAGYHLKLIFEAVSQDGKGNFSLEISK